VNDEERRIARRLGISEDDLFRSNLSAVQTKLDEVRRDPKAQMNRQRAEQAVGEHLGVSEEDRERGAAGIPLIREA